MTDCDARSASDSACVAYCIGSASLTPCACKRTDGSMAYLCTLFNMLFDMSILMMLPIVLLMLLPCPIVPRP